jgi:Flp pilus assembly protein TadD
VSHALDLGIAQYLRHQYEEAAAAFREVLRGDPANAAAWSFYGMALAHLGRAADAEAALSRAVELAPQNGEAWFHLGIARGLREEWADAASAYRRAVALAPGDVVAWHRLGVACAESGDESSASAAFERALVLSRDVPSAEAAPPARPASLLDDHVEELGEREGGREAKSWLDLALSLLSLGDQEEAIAAYERAYTLDPARARASLFRPMLRLVTTVGSEPPPPGPARPEVS